VVRYLVKIRGVRPEQIAVFAQQDAYGDSGFAGVAKAMRALRGGNEGRSYASTTSATLWMWTMRSRASVPTRSL
jgi:hypothetical protein